MASSVENAGGGVDVRLPYRDGARMACRAVVITLAMCAWAGTASGQQRGGQLAALEGARVAGNPAAADDNDEAAERLRRMEADFRSYLQFAVMGRFDESDAFASSLLEHPDLTPELTDAGADGLIMLTEKYDRSLETLQLIMVNTEIGENAARVMDLVARAHKIQRMRPSRIRGNIALLNGTPMQRKVGLERLIESGEYAVPWMLETLADPDEKELYPFIVRALPSLGKRALNPLIEGLGIEDPRIRGLVVQTLGRIGYPQALPYLQRIVEDPDENPAVRDAAVMAVRDIIVSDPSVREQKAADLFVDLAEQYYANEESLQPDPREPAANVWFLRRGFLVPVEVPHNIYMVVMCMRAAEDALALSPDRPSVIALWLAANFRREAGMGLDVQSEEVVETLDMTRPFEFPRSVYFARIFGPRVAQISLHRGVRDRDRNVALGSIAALNVTAGPAAMVEPADPGGLSLAAALSFPDTLVRIRAGLALGGALPTSGFRGSEHVVPVLASALSLSGVRHYLVVEPNTRAREAIVGELTREGARVVAADRLTPALEQAHRELTHLDGIVLATDIRGPHVIEALRQLDRDPRFSLAPIVLLVKRDDALLGNQAREADPRIGLVFDTSDDGLPPADVLDQLRTQIEHVAPRFGYEPLTGELALELALGAARTLHTIAVSGTPVLDTAVAETALIQALSQPDENLRVACARALSLIGSADAQEAIASVALDPAEGESLRIAAYDALAESARRFGARLHEGQTQELIEQATTDPNLTLRTAASQTMGAMNLPGQTAAEIILAQPKPNPGPVRQD